MNAYEYAMEMEKEGEAFYRELAKSTDDSSLKNIFLTLADEEVKHYEMFEALSKGDDSAVPKMDDMKDIKEIFSNLKGFDKNLTFGTDQVAYYKKALEAEDKAYALYIKKAEEVENPEHKKVFLQIAEEEKKHQEVLENLVEFISCPNEWVANAEF